MCIKYFKIISSFFLKLFGGNRFVNSVKVFSLNIKLMKPIQKHPHVIESYAFILKIFVSMDKEWPINAVIYFGICPTPKLLKEVTLLLFAYKATQWVPIS